MHIVEILEKQDTIIEMQSEIINELFQILAQQLPADELGALDCLEEIHEVARLKEELE